MIEFVTSPKGEAARAIFEQAKDVLGVTKASQWMFSANAWLDGKTPMQALREGDEKGARCCVGMLIENSKKKAA